MLQQESSFLTPVGCQPAATLRLGQPDNASYSRKFATNKFDQEAAPADANDADLPPWADLTVAANIDVTA